MFDEYRLHRLKKLISNKNNALFPTVNTYLAFVPHSPTVALWFEGFFRSVE